MKNYNHTKTISLRKPNTQYISRIDGTVVWFNDIRWYKDVVTNIKFCFIKISGNERGEATRYTYTEFHDVFKEYVSIEQQLINETIKAAHDGLPIYLTIHNNNGRSYPEDVWMTQGANKVKINSHNIKSNSGFEWTY